MKKVFLYIYSLMKYCIECGKEFSPQTPGASSLRGPTCEKDFQARLVFSETLEDIANTLDKKGYPVYLVGGSVRDLILNRPLKDYDLATSATPEILESLFPQASLTGKSFGVIKYPLGGSEFIDIATFRKDGEYSDGRHPNSVEFSTVEEDAARRDFTINALFLDIKTKEIKDFHGGLEDILNKKIKAVGSAEDRFNEDSLRMLRAVRFASALEFDIEETTLSAIQKLKNKVHLLSKERIKEEIDKMSKNPFVAFKLLKKSGLLEELFPKANSNYLSTAKKMDLLSKIDDPQEKKLWFWANLELNNLKDFKLTNDEIVTIASYQDNFKKLKSFNDIPLAEKNATLISPVFNKVHNYFKLQENDEIVVKYLKILKEHPIDLNLIPSGDDLIKKGIVPGVVMGKILKEIKVKLLSREIKTTTEINDLIKNYKI